MVKSRLYCSEQIEIPETFPNILKTYAKAAIRTQPYDLLRWSAAYFRCLANDVPPPVKQRLERDCRHGTLTKGYLKVLVEQVGKGYFISRKLLQKRWAALCLPEEELLKYLSVCRMLNWPQVHWLKVFAVMVGSLNETPCGTFNMICELLTEDLEGGPSRIPTWIFRECYTFISELDCSKEQCFVNGRKKLPNGDLEDETEMGRMPEVLSSTSIREAIFDNCKQRYNVDCQCRPKHTDICEPTFKTDGSCIHADRETSVSSGFQFLGDVNEPIEILRRYNDFDSLILLLREAQGATLHNYEGPGKITQNNIDHALRREEEIMFDRELQDAFYEDTSKKCMLQERINMLRELGPPWTWIQQFAADSCMDKSFNFIEIESIISDVTPPISSDESFDFCKGRPVINADAITLSAVSNSTSEHASELIQESDRTDEEWKKNQTMMIVRSILKTAEEQSEVNVAEVSSVVTFLCNVEEQVWEKAGQPATEPVDVKEIIDTLKIAHEKGITFETIDHMMDYLKYWKDKAEMFVGPSKEAAEEGVPPQTEEEAVEEASKYADGSLEEHYDEDSQKSEESLVAEKITPRSVGEQGKESAPSSPEHPKPTQKQGQHLKKTESTEDDAIDEIREKKPMLDIFVDSGTLPDDTKLIMKETCDILGTVPKPEIKPEEPVVEEEQSAITPSGTVSELGAFSDVSSLQPNSEPPKQRKIFQAYKCPHSDSAESMCLQKDSFCCVVTPHPGIGPAVSKQTIQDFLTYLKGKSRHQKGMIMPMNFVEPKCPAMVDVVE